MLNRDVFRALADKQGIALRTLSDVKATLSADKAKGDGTDVAMARLMLKHGRLTDEARAYVAQEYPQD